MITTPLRRLALASWHTRDAIPPKRSWTLHTWTINQVWHKYLPETLKSLTPSLNDRREDNLNLATDNFLPERVYRPRAMQVPVEWRLFRRRRSYQKRPRTGTWIDKAGPSKWGWPVSRSQPPFRHHVSMPIGRPCSLVSRNKSQLTVQAETQGLHRFYSNLHLRGGING